MLDFHRSLLGSRLLAIGFALSMIWAGIILVTSVIEFNDLILLLEKYISPDSHISQPYRAVAKLIVAPGLVMSIILMIVITRQTWSFPIYVLYGYLLFLGMHFIVYLSYTNIVLGGLKEDSLLEWGTFGCAMLASILFLISGILRTRFAYLLFIAWLIFALEEISWGQRVFNIESPSFFKEYNYQQETNIHNFLNPYLPYFPYYLLYVFFNSIVFLSLTWFRRIQILSKLYRMRGISYVLDISDRFGLWLIPFFLIFLSFYPGNEFVEEQWSVFGVLLSSLLLYFPAHHRSRP